MIGIQAIHKADVEAVLPQETSDIEKTEGLDPEVIGGEIVYPRIDEKDGLLHVSSMPVMVKKAKPFSPVHR